MARVDKYNKDENCSSLLSANKFIVQCMVDCTEHSDVTKEIPSVMIKTIVENLKKSNSLKNFHQTSAARTYAVIQIDEVFEGKSGGRDSWKLVFRADADIPGPDSTQGPHLGYEVKFNGKRIGIGHGWVPGGLLTIGRPPRAVVDAMDNYMNGSNTKEDFPNQGKMIWTSTFKRSKS
ncbi:unnamed protein product [Rotaria socialis]|uniref:Uncharacterized protein n=1 Tax=Rotaria socialis TaxID=392032 RepID=A0A818B0W3_9BILA|nr:unnamed protein product [Rotaria socialis]CAF4498056.1 unnamed protein product [Rotaria socialis]